jgi:hypothetical protein
MIEASGVRSLPLHFPHDRLAGANNLLLTRKGGGGLVAEDVEVRLPDQVVRRVAGDVGGDPARTDEQEPAQPVLEVHTFTARGQQVAHAHEHELAL